MKRLLFVGLMLGLCSGCFPEKAETSGQNEELQVLLEKQAQEIMEIRASQKGEEFRNLSMAIPIGKGGKLRIVNPKDDEGNDLYTPSDFIGAYLTEADKIRSVAGNMVVSPKPPSLPAEDLVTKQDLQNLLEAVKATDEKVEKLIPVKKGHPTTGYAGKCYNCHDDGRK